MLTTAFRSEIVELLFLNSDVANIGNAGGLRGSTVAGSFYASLHTAYPGLGGDQTTSECAYTGYGRQAVARSGSGFARTSNYISPVSHVEFGKCTSGSSEVIHFVGIGTDSSGAGNLILIAGLGLDLIPFTATASDETVRAPDLTGQSPAWAVDDKVTVYGITGPSSLPTGLAEGTVYFIKTITGSALTLSATQGGSTLNITADGAGFIQKLIPITVAPPNGVPRVENTTRFYLV